MPAGLCAFCNHANAAGSKFCSECGAALRLTLCPECEAVNDRTRTACYKCGADLYASAIFAQAATAATAPAQAGTQTETEPVETTREVAAELSGSAPFAPTDGATEAASELPAHERRWKLNALADAPSEVSLSEYRWRPSNPTLEMDVEHPRSSVPESAARALEATSAADAPLIREAVAAPPSIPEIVTAPPTRTTSTPFVILGLLVIAAAAYYGYRNDRFAPAVAWLNSTPAYQALERRAAGWGNRGADSAQTRETSAAAPDTGSDRSTPSPSVNDGPTAQTPAAPVTPAAAPSDDATQSPALPSAQLPTQPSTPPPVEQSSPAPDDAASAKAPVHCSDAATAMGLCNPDKSGEGK